MQKAVFIFIKCTFKKIKTGCSYIIKPVTIDTYIINIRTVEDIFFAHPEAQYIFLAHHNLYGKSLGLQPHFLRSQVCHTLTH